ncbi:unnamed protein product [Linum trigynum]|uniref:Uncharacterized protein n=1 Tax=Linum trigynum TaxID=586398 RepID=A0AAV2FPY0_9ROSI
MLYSIVEVLSRKTKSSIMKGLEIKSLKWPKEKSIDQFSKKPTKPIAPTTESIMEPSKWMIAATRGVDGTQDCNQC